MICVWIIIFGVVVKLQDGGVKFVDNQAWKKEGVWGRE